MRKTTPGELIEMIDAQYAALKVTYKSSATEIGLGAVATHSGGNWLRAFLNAVDAIDDDSHHVEWKYYEPLQRACETLNGLESSQINVLPSVRDHDGVDRSPMVVIRNALCEFRSTTKANQWPEIGFMETIDSDLWLQLCIDLDEVHKALSVKSWKAATVVSASVMEALLANWLRSKLTNAPEKLSAMIDEAAKLGLFDPPIGANAKYERTEAVSKKGAAMCAANYRNLIHSDKAARMLSTCTRASAWETLGATLMVAEAIGAKP